MNSTNQWGAIWNEWRQVIGVNIIKHQVAIAVPEEHLSSCK